MCLFVFVDIFGIVDLMIDLLCLTPLSAIFHLYHGDYDYLCKLF
jgi:hypothetical protein